MRKPKLLFYCQYLLGVGHLTRSLALCQELVQCFEVHFVQGGPDIGRSLKHADFHLHLLEPLLMHGKGELYDPRSNRPVADVFEDRAKTLKGVIDLGPFAVVVTELFPFGRGRFKPEILQMITTVREINPQVVRACSVRDILVPKPNAKEREQKIVKIVNDNYDRVYVHSDPRWIQLKETFAKESEIQEKVVYTGYVSERAPSQGFKVQRQNQVLVSHGGGAVGGELLVAAALASKRISEYHFKIVIGPYTPASIREHLERLKITEGYTFSLVEHLLDFEIELRASALSVSMGGYNTVVNLLNTQTPALVFPYQAEPEQNFRAQLLAKAGLFGIIAAQDLVEENDGEKLGSMIKQQLKSDRPEFAVNLDGARRMTEDLRQISGARSS